MEGRTLIDSSCVASINAPIKSIDLTTWLFTLTDIEYQNCSSAHIGAGTTKDAEGKRISLNVELIGPNLYIQHYHERISERTHCETRSMSDLLNNMERGKIEIVWSLSVRALDAHRSEFTNRFASFTTREMEESFLKNGVTLEQIQKDAQTIADAHNAEETPNFAKDIERKANEGRFGSA